MSLFNEHEFKKCVDRYKGDLHAIKFNCRDQFMMMSFAQFIDRAGLRDTETTLNFCEDLCCLGIKVMPCSALAETNEKKDWCIYQDFAMILMKDTTVLYKDEKLRLVSKRLIYAFDSCTIELCLKLCPWAELHHSNGAFKMHMLMDLRGSVPTFVLLMQGKVNDAKVMDKISVEAGVFYTMDKGYVAFEKLYKYFRQKGAYFVTHAKYNMAYEVIEFRPIDKCSVVLSDEIIRLTGHYAIRMYPDALRLVVYEDFEAGKVYCFLTNNFAIEDPLTIAELYRELYKTDRPC